MNVPISHKRNLAVDNSDMPPSKLAHIIQSIHQAGDLAADVIKIAPVLGVAVGLPPLLSYLLVEEVPIAEAITFDGLVVLGIVVLPLLGCFLILLVASVLLPVFGEFIFKSAQDEFGWDNSAYSYREKYFPVLIIVAWLASSVFSNKAQPAPFLLVLVALFLWIAYLSYHVAKAGSLQPKSFWELLIGYGISCGSANLLGAMWLLSWSLPIFISIGDSRLDQIFIETTLSPNLVWAISIAVFWVPLIVLSTLHFRLTQLTPNLRTSIVGAATVVLVAIVIFPGAPFLTARILQLVKVGGGLPISLIPVTVGLPRHGCLILATDTRLILRETSSDSPCPIIGPYVFFRNIGYTASSEKVVTVKTKNYERAKRTVVAKITK